LTAALRGVTWSLRAVSHEQWVLLLSRISVICINILHLENVWTENVNIFHMLSCGYAYIIVLNVHIMLQIEICCSECQLAVDITLLSLYSVKYILTDLSRCPDGIIVANMQQIMAVSGDRKDYAQSLLFCSVLYSCFLSYFTLLPFILLCSVLFHPVLLCSTSSYFYSAVL
jgi:hypothetical protein